VAQYTLMAQGSNGSTKHSRVRVRNWFFTLNNYILEDIELFKSLDCKYVFQEETGEEKGVKHLQGLLMFKHPRTLKGMKEVHPRCHWEVCRNLNASKEYCSKLETRTGEIFSNFDLSIEVAHGTRHIVNKKFEPPSFESFCYDLNHELAFNDSLKSVFKYIDVVHPYM